MEIRVLKYFLAVAREQNMTRAANFLHITQPTLSRQIMQLEEELGQTLFLRKQRKMVLTETGKLLFRKAEEILALVEKTEEDLKAEGKLVSGKISIGSAESASSQVLIRIFQQFSSMYPNVQYELYTGNADSIEQRIDQGLLDFGLLVEPADVKKYESIYLNQQEKWGILMRSDVPLAQKPFVTATDLLGLPILSIQRTAVRNQLSKWLGQELEDVLNVVATYNLLGNAALMVEAGLGYAFTIEGAASRYHDTTLCFRPLYPELCDKSVFIWKKDQPTSNVAKKFLQLLTKEKL